MKIERPDGGDPARRIGPFPDDEPHHEKSGLFLELNTGKQSVTLNLKTHTGRAILRRLAADADLVVESFRPGTVARLGLGDEALREANPLATLVQISNFGQEGPYRDWEADDLVAYALSGLLSITGDPTREPIKIAAFAPLFLVGGMVATMAFGAMTVARRTGRGERVDIAILDALAGAMDRGAQNLAALEYSGDLFVNRETLMGWTATNAIPGGAYGKTYPTADGYVQIIARVNWWDRFCRVIGRPELIDDPQYTQHLHDPTYAPRVEALLYPWLLERSKQEAMEQGQAQGLPIAALNRMDDVFRDPHLRARDFFVKIDHPFTGPLEYPGPPFRFRDIPVTPRRAPLLGEHTSEVLRSRLGYTPEDVVRLRQRNVV